MAFFVIDTPKEFSFNQSLHFLKRSPNELLHAVNGDSVEKAITVNGEVYLIAVMLHSPNQLRISVRNKKITSPAKAIISAYIQTWLDLETDLRPFYRIAGKDSLLRPLVKKYSGYRIVTMPDLFESLSWAIIGQQINLSFAYTLKKRFVEQFGNKFLWKRKAYYLFPTPEKIATLEPAELLPLQFSKQKAAYITTLAKTFSAAIISKEKLLPLSFEDAKEELIKLKGIGNWTANYVLMKTFRFPNAFPIEDAGLHQAIRKHLQLKGKPSLPVIEKIFKNYQGWEAYATLYFWRSLSDD